MIQPFTLARLPSGGFENKLFLASRKNDYDMVFFHGPNLADGMDANITTRTDRFAAQGFLVRLPRVVRLILDSSSGTPATSFTSHYDDAAGELADLLEEHNIAVAWGQSANALARRWLREVTPDGEAANFTPAQIIAGHVLTFVFRPATLAYAENDLLIGPNANYEADYEDFVANHARHAGSRTVLYNNQLTVFGDDDQEVIDHMIAGTGLFASLGPGLGDFGWEAIHSEWDIPANYVPVADLYDVAQDFFGL